MAALLLNSAACISVTTPGFLMPAPERDWKSTLQQARAQAARGRAAQADSLLARYASAYPDTPGATESLYWRSLFQIQSGSALGSPTSMLDTYLGQPLGEHRVEAEALFRTTSRIDSLNRAANTLANKVQVSTGEVASAANRAADAKADAKAETKDQDSEIKKLRAELAASKEELERIKKRLAEPPKKPPKTSG
ncbi:MAG: hypothetical protein ABIR92_11015 [Gemmatimonadaceae bacterium]